MTGIFIPDNLDKAVESIVSRLSQADVDRIKTGDPAHVHMSVGRYYRNDWRLWDRESPLVKWFIDNLGIVHGDDLSGTILSAVWAKVRNEPFDAIAHVQRYKDHWAKYGVDPMNHGAK